MNLMHIVFKVLRVAVRRKTRHNYEGKSTYIVGAFPIVYNYKRVDIRYFFYQET